LLRELVCKVVSQNILFRPKITKKSILTPTNIQKTKEEVVELVEISRYIRKLNERLKENNNSLPLQEVVNFKDILNDLIESNKKHVKEFDGGDIKNKNCSKEIYGGMTEESEKIKDCSMKKLGKIKLEMEKFQENPIEEDVIAEEYEKTINSFKEELSEVKRSVTMYEQHIKQITNENVRLEQEITKLKKKLEDSETDKDTLSTEYIEIIENLNLKQEELFEKINKQDKIIKDLEDTSSAIKQYKGSTVQLKKENESLKEKIKIMEKNTNQNKIESKKLIKKATHIKEQIKSNGVIVNAIQSCLHINIKPKEVVEDVKKRLGEVEKENNELKNNYNTKVFELDKVKKKAKTLWESFEKFNKRKQELGEEVKKMQVEATNSRHIIEEYTNKISVITSELKQLKADKEQLAESSSLGVQKERIEQLEVEQERLNNLLKEKEQQMNKQTEDYKTLLLKLKDEHCKLFNKFNTLKKTSKTERELLKAKEKEVEQLRSKLDVNL